MSIYSANMELGPQKTIPYMVVGPQFHIAIINGASGDYGVYMTWIRVPSKIIFYLLQDGSTLEINCLGLKGSCSCVLSFRQNDSSIRTLSPNSTHEARLSVVLWKLLWSVGGLRSLYQCLLESLKEPCDRPSEAILRDPQSTASSPQSLQYCGWLQPTTA